jgi:hypothetical protein
MKFELIDADRIAGMWRRSNLRAMNSRGTSRAASSCMRTSSMVGTLVVLMLASRSAREDVTPRATDLLRARKLAERTEERLQLPAPESPGWLRGGWGWDDDRGATKRPPHRVRSR